MAAHDDLLLWCSEVREGSVARLREACAWTAQKSPLSWSAWEVMSDLVALGHIEVDFETSRWQVVRPTLSLLADGAGLGLMVGARPRWLRNRLEALHKDFSDVADELFLFDELEQAGPSSWYAEAGLGLTAGALSSVGLRLVDDLAGAQLGSLLDGWDVGKTRVVRPGELTHRMLIEGNALTGSVTWEPMESDRSPAMYKYLRNNRPIVAERAGDSWQELDQRAAVWRALPPTSRCLWVAPREHRLLVAAIERLPVPLERALVLRSGRLPATAPVPAATGSPQPVRIYENISTSLAGHVAALIGKELVYA
jgi:hypothetical protein